MCCHKVDRVAGLAVVARIQVAAACHTGCKATLHACSNITVNQGCEDRCSLKQPSALLLPCTLCTMWQTYTRTYMQVWSQIMAGLNTHGLRRAKICQLAYCGGLSACKLTDLQPLLWPEAPPASPLMKRRTSSLYLPFHSAHTSQLGKCPTCRVACLNIESEEQRRHLTGQ